VRPLNCCSALAATLSLLLSHGVLCGRELTGVVYSDHSGVSGHGTGRLGLATKTGLVSLHYQKPVKQRFSNASCEDLGAIWIVRTELIDPTGEELVSARCDGGLDVQVHSAWMAVRNYIKSVAEAVGQTLGYKPGRRGPVPVDMNGNKVDISGYLNFGVSGMCLEVNRRIDSKTIIIRSSADCYFYPDLDFRVTETTPTLWRVISVEAADETAR